MEIVLLVVGVIVLCVFLVAQDSQKKTQKEKYLDAIGQVAHSAADTITGVAYRITESSSEKVHREALEVLAQRNGSLYRGGGSYSQKGYIKRLFEVDEFFKKKSLDVLGLSVERWQRIGRHLFYVGAIKYFSRDHSDFTKKNDEDRRAWIINEWVKETGFGLLIHFERPWLILIFQRKSGLSMEIQFWQCITSMMIQILSDLVLSRRLRHRTIICIGFDSLR